jgi:hypothetical protein
MGLEDEARINPCRPTLGYNRLRPIVVSGRDGVVAYLRRLVVDTGQGEAAPHVSPRDAIWSASRLAILGDTEAGFFTSGGSMWVCRVRSREGEDDLFFEVVDGIVEEPEAPNGWRLAPSICNPNLELLDDPRFTADANQVQVVEDAARIERVLLAGASAKSTAAAMRGAPGPTSSPDTSVPSNVRAPAVIRTLSSEERARRVDADSFPAARKAVVLGDHKIEIADGHVGWDGARFRSADVDGLCWGVDQDTGRMWIKIRARDELAEAEWCPPDQADAEVVMRRLIGLLMSEVRQPIVSSIRKRLLGAGSERIGHVELARAGVWSLSQGLFSSKPSLCPWSEIHTEIERAAVSVKLGRGRRAPIRLGLDVENAFALHFLPGAMLSM